MDSVLLKNLDRINRIDLINFWLSGRKPETTIACGENFLIDIWD